MSKHPQLFIAYAPDGRRSKEKELQDSKARAHAARWAYQRARQQRRISYQGTTTSGTGGGSSLPGTRDEHGHAGLASEQSGEQRRSLLLSDTDIEASGRLGGEGAWSLEQFLSPYEYWQLCQDVFTAGGVVSPVQSYPVRLDGNRLRSIEYFPELWSRWAADVIPNRNERQEATHVAVRSIVQRCLTDELHMLAFISYVLQRAPTVNVSKVFLLRTAGKALSELRARIEGGNASLEEVVWPIIFLAHYELFGSKSVGAGRAHLKAVVELGGMEYLDEVTKVYIRRMDRGWWSDYPSIFPTSNSPRLRWERLVPHVSIGDIAGSGFFNQVDILGSNLMSILPSVVDCVRAGVLCKERLLLGTEDEALQNKVIRKCQSLMDIMRGLLPAEPEKMACIYPAMIWLQYTTWVMRDLATKASSSVNAYRNITSHAHPNLLRCVEQSSQAHEMLLWAAGVGMATSAEEAARIQYAACGLNLARSLDVVDLRNLWKKYIWFEAYTIIDYGLICAALDEAVRQDPLLATEQWEVARRRLLFGD